MIYLDYAATTPLDAEALSAMSPYFTECFGNADSLHSLGRKAAYAVTCARDEIAFTLGVRPEEVYFTSGGTEGDNWALRGLLAASGKRRFALSEIEHHALLETSLLLEKEGMERIFLPVNTSGAVDLESANSLIDSDTGVVSVMAVNNETGCIQPIRQLSEICRKRGVYLHSDCVQAALTQDLKEICSNCDAITLSGHKLYGPKGIGALVVKGNIPMKPLIVGGEQERRLRGGTSNVPAIVGFAKALTSAQRSFRETALRMETIRDAFEDYILRRLGEIVRIDGENRSPAISHLTFSFDGAEGLVNRLDLYGVACSSGAACASHSPLPSHVLAAMGRSERELKGGVRFSFGKGTTTDEALEAAQAVCECVRSIERGE